MTEIIYGVSDLYVSSTGWAMWGAEGTPGGGGGGQGGQGSTFSENFDAGMPAGWTTVDANNDGYNWVLGSQIGGVYLISGASLAGSGHNSSADLICSGSYSNATNQAITPDNYLVSPQVTLAAGSTFSFWACAQDAGYPAEHFGVFVSDNGTSDWTEVQSWTMTAKSGGNVMSIGRGGETRAQGNWYNYSVDLSAYAGQKYVAIRHFNCNDQFILDVDDVELTNGAKDGDRHLEYFKVMCTSIDGEPIFNADTEHPF
ncbi:MAG: hemagglutinin protein HagA, partial [bacterium F083]